MRNFAQTYRRLGSKPSATRSLKSKPRVTRSTTVPTGTLDVLRVGKPRRKTQHYAQIGLSFEAEELVDYDGVFWLPREIGEVLTDAGFVVRDDCSPDYCLPNREYSG